MPSFYMDIYIIIQSLCLRGELSASSCAMASKKRAKFDGGDGTVHAYGVSQKNVFKVIKQLQRRGDCDSIDPDALPTSYAGWKHRNNKDILRVSKVLVAKQLSLPGVDWKWHVPSLTSLIEWHIDHNDIFRRHLQSVCEERDPDEPIDLHMVSYCDEFTPGNVLAPEIKNKCNNWYVSFLDLGKALSVQHLWLHAASLLSRKAEQLSTGFSAASRILMESWLDEVPSVTAGFVICFPNGNGKTFLLKVHLDPNIWDEKALKEVWFSKGSAGKKPCLQCLNVVHKLMHEVLQPGFVDISEPDANKFVQAGDHEIYGMFDFLESIAGTGVCAKAEIAAGIKYDPTSLLASQKLRDIVKPSGNRYDYCHTHHSNGIIQHEIDLMIKELSTDKVMSNSEVQIFLRANWCYGVGSRVLLQVKDDEIKAQATEVRNVVHIFRHFVDTVLVHKSHRNAPWRPDILATFRALHNSVCQIEYMLGVEDFGDAACDTLQRLQKTHMEAFLQSHGVEKVRPKHHMALHLPAQIKRDKYLVHAFPLELKHKLIKDILEDYHNTNAEDLELRLCCKSALHQKDMVQEIQEERQRIFQEQNRAILDGEDILLSLTAGTPWGHFATNKIVVHGESVGTVLAVMVNSRQEWELLVQLRKIIKQTAHANASFWQPTDQHCRWPLPDSLCT